MTGYDFEIAYKSDASGSYLVIVLNGNMESIIRYQAEIVSNNRIRGLLPFKLIQRNELIQLKYDITSLLRLKDFICKRDIAKEILYIFTGICDAVLESRGFLLDENCFVMHREFIYINPASLEVYLVYIPIKKTNDINRAFWELILNITNELSDSEEKQYKSKNYFKKIFEFLQQDDFTVLGFKEFLQNFSDTSIKWEDAADLHVSAYNQSESRENNHNILKSKDINNSLSGIIGFFKPILKIIPIRKRKKLDKSSHNKIRFIDSGTIADTVILSQQEIYQPCLVFGNGENKEKIKLSDNFMLGRLKEKVDYVVDNRAVGKIHACIRTRNGKYYIVDLNSKNGTFINGIRIESNIEYEIKDKDEISLANIEFTFIFPSS